MVFYCLAKRIETEGKNAQAVVYAMGGCCGAASAGWVRFLEDGHAKVQHWRGDWGIFGLGGAWVLGFGTFTDVCGPGLPPAGFRNLLGGLLCGGRGGNLLFVMKLLVYFCGMIGSDVEGFAAAVLPQLS